MSLTPPKLRGPLVPRTVDGETMWLSADGAWVLVARAPLERRVGRALGADVDRLDEALDLGLGMARGSSTADDAFADEEDLFAVDAEEGTGAADVEAWSVEVDEVDEVDEADEVDEPAAASSRPPPSPRPPPLRSQLTAVPPAPASNSAEEAVRRMWWMSILTFAAAMVLVLVAVLVVVVGRPAPPPPPPPPVLTPVDASLDLVLPEPLRSLVPYDTAVDSDTDTDDGEPEAPAGDDGPSTPEDAALVTAAAAEGVVIEEAPQGHPVLPSPTIHLGANAPAPAWQSHLRDGWDLIDIDPVTAEQHFRTAIVLYPRHGDAYRGLGEAMLRQGKRSLANDYLCEARRLDRGLKASIDTLMAAESMTCDGRGR